MDSPAAPLAPPASFSSTTSTTTCTTLETQKTTARKNNDNNHNNDNVNHETTRPSNNESKKQSSSSTSSSILERMVTKPYQSGSRTIVDEAAVTKDTPTVWNVERWNGGGVKRPRRVDEDHNQNDENDHHNADENDDEIRMEKDRQIYTFRSMEDVRKRVRKSNSSTPHDTATAEKENDHHNADENDDEKGMEENRHRIFTSMEDVRKRVLKSNSSTPHDTATAEKEEDAREETETVVQQQNVPDNKLSSSSSSSPFIDDYRKSKSPGLSSRGSTILSGPEGHERWRAHRIAEDYINIVNNMMFPGTFLAPFGHDPASGQYPLERIATLGILTSPLRRPTVVERWSPYEVATFESALALCGKQFHQVQKFVKSKNTKEIIEFYYIWKKTSHYKAWKRQFVNPDLDFDSDDG